MKKTHKLLIAFLGIIVLAVVVFKAMQPKEPEYQGKKLSAWMADLQEKPPAHDDAKKAIHEIGVEALPWIEAKIKRSRNPVVTSMFQKRVQDLLEAVHLRSREAEIYGWIANFSALEAVGVDALPVLERLLANPEYSDWAADTLAKLDALDILKGAVSPSNRAFIRHSAVIALGDIPRQKDAACDLLLSLSREADSEIVSEAVYALGRLQHRPEISVARLRELLKQSDVRIRYASILVLGQFGTNAVSALPDLEKVKSADIGTAEMVEGAIQMIDFKPVP